MERVEEASAALHHYSHKHTGGVRLLLIIHSLQFSIVTAVANEGVLRRLDQRFELWRTHRSVRSSIMQRLDPFQTFEVISSGNRALNNSQLRRQQRIGADLRQMGFKDLYLTAAAAQTIWIAKQLPRRQRRTSSCAALYLWRASSVRFVQNFWFRTHTCVRPTHHEHVGLRCKSTQN